MSGTCRPLLVKYEAECPEFRVSIDFNYFETWAFRQDKEHKDRIEVSRDNVVLSLPVQEFNKGFKIIWQE